MPTQPPVIPVVPQVVDQGVLARALVSGYEAGTRTAAINADIWRTQMQNRLNEERATLQLANQMQQLELKEAAMEMASRQKEAELALRAQQFNDKLAFEAEKAQLGAIQKGLDRASREEIAGMGVESREKIAGMNIEARADRDARYRSWMDQRPGEKIKDMEMLAMEAYRQEMLEAGGDSKKTTEAQAKWLPLFGGRGMTPDALLKIAELTEMYKTYEASPELQQRYGNNLAAFRRGKEEAGDAQTKYNIAMSRKVEVDKAPGSTWLDRNKAYEEAQKAYATLQEYNRLFGRTNAPPAPPISPGGRARLEPGLLPAPTPAPRAEVLNPRLPPARQTTLDLNATFGPNQPNAVSTLYLGNTNATVDRNKFLDWTEVTQ